MEYRVEYRLTRCFLLPKLLFVLSCTFVCILSPHFSLSNFILYCYRFRLYRISAVPFIHGDLALRPGRIRP